MWRVALIDSGAGTHALAQGRFDQAGVGPLAISTDPTGHGSRLAALLHEFASPHELILGQVFGESSPTTVAALAAAIAWAVQQRSQLIHLSLGLQADRPALSDAINGAIEAGSLVIAATPAQGPPVYPASYPGVIAGTGDARCQRGEISRLGFARFGGCATYQSALHGAGRGASVGAAFVTTAILNHCRPGAPVGEVLDTLRQRARYDGPENRSHREIVE